MRPSVVVSFVLCAGLARAAAAAPAEAVAPVEVFSVQNADELRDQWVVAYPSRCAGGPERDYAVVLAGIETTMPPCKGSQLYVVEREGFTGVDMDGVAELDAMSAAERADFFARDPRAHATRHPVRAEPRRVGAGDRLRKIHDVLRVERDDADFFVIGERVVYGYADGTEEVIPFIAGRRPPPTGRSAEPEEGPRVRLSSDIPRWPWILGACVVFAGMAVYGLRRRS
ncbi:MAG: hypothetical protein JNL82_09960 [Myxococcales bacterium]|nr:hypothetical protein [Myxococcales bacterium]